MYKCGIHVYRLNKEGGGLLIVISYLINSFLLSMTIIIILSLSHHRCPQIAKPCLYSIHASPVTCLKIYDNAPKDLLQDLNEITLSNTSTNEYMSNSVSDTLYS